MLSDLKRFFTCQDGTTALEYAFIAGLVSITIITALGAMSDSISGLFTGVASTISGTAGG